MSEEWTTKGKLKSNTSAMVPMGYELTLRWISIGSQKIGENKFIWTNVSLYSSMNLLSTLVSWLQAIHNELVHK